MSTQSVVLLYQKLGNTLTNYPILVLGDRRVREAVAIGQGFWRWRLQEHSLYGRSKAFDEIISKTLQYLSLKTNKKRFIFRPLAIKNNEYDNVDFECELYNEIYEPIIGSKIILRLREESANSSDRLFEFVNSTVPFKYSLSSLKNGVYNYEAIANYKGKTFIEKGEFIVEKLDIEFLNTKANFNFLSELARKNQGEYYTINTIDTLIHTIVEREDKTKTIVARSSLSIIQLSWISFIIVALISLEWVIRKII